MGLVSWWHVESSQTRDQTHDLCFGRWILNHWTTRKVHNAFYLVFNVILRKEKIKIISTNLLIIILCNVHFKMQI